MASPESLASFSTPDRERILRQESIGSLTNAPIPSVPSQAETVAKKNRNANLVEDPLLSFVPEGSPPTQQNIGNDANTPHI